MFVLPRMKITRRDKAYSAVTGVMGTSYGLRPFMAFETIKYCNRSFGFRYFVLVANEGTSNAFKCTRLIFGSEQISS